MKKLLTVVSLTLLTVLLALSFSGCSKTNKLQKAYEDAGYTCTVTTMSDDDKKAAEDNIAKLEGDEKKTAQEAYDVMKKCETLTAKKGIVTVTIMYVPNLKDNFTKVAGALGGSSYDALNKAGNIKGDFCYIGVAAGDTFDIFSKNA